MSHAVRKSGWVLAGLLALGVTGWAATPHSSPHHSAAAISGCQDAAQIQRGLNGAGVPPEVVMSDLVQLAPKVTDADLQGAFRAFSVAYSTDNVNAGLQAVSDIHASCLHAGLP